MIAFFSIGTFYDYTNYLRLVHGIKRNQFSIPQQSPIKQGALKLKPFSKTFFQFRVDNLRFQY